MRIFHLTTAHEWARAQRAGTYTTSTRGRSLEQEGYIHCSEKHQVEKVRRRWYDGQPNVVVLEVETDRLSSPWRSERLDGADDVYPHVYGPLNLDAVVGVQDVGTATWAIQRGSRRTRRLGAIRPTGRDASARSGQQDGTPRRDPGNRTGRLGAIRATGRDASAGVGGVP